MQRHEQVAVSPSFPPSLTLLSLTLSFPLFSLSLSCKQGAEISLLSHVAACSPLVCKNNG